MKHSLRLYLSLTLFLTALSFSSSAQQTIQGVSDTLIHPTPIIGFNSNGHFPTLNWATQQFIDSTAAINPAILRYPGGTVSNYWDWQTGWWMPAWPHPNPVTVRPEEFQNGLNAANAEGLFVLNYRNSNLAYQMAELRHIDTLGINIGYVEIGNEHNLDQGPDTNQYVPPTIYGQDCKRWCDTIKNEFPNAKICLVGGVPPSVPQWHDSILYFNPNMDAFAWHVYLGANNTDLIFNVNRALSVPFGNSGSSLQGRWIASEFDSLPPNIDVWVTEYNLLESSNPNSGHIIAQTWTHALYVTVMNHYFLSKPKIKMIINHSLGSANKYFTSVDSLDYHITANGVAMKLLLDVAKNTDTTQQIIFNPSPTLTYGSTTYPKLIGWKFKDSNNENGFICNLSTDTFKLSLANVFINPMQFDEYYADTAFIVSGLSSVNKYSGNSSDSIVIYPFSITQINTSLTTGIQNQQTTNKNGLWIYPNPSQSTIIIQTNHSLTNAEILVYNIMGQEVKKIQNVSGNKIQLMTDGLIKGTYLIKIKNGQEMLTTKIIVE